MDEGKTAQALYDELAPNRDPYLNRARDCSALTIPYLVPPTAPTGGSVNLPTPHTAVGARGVKNLAGKLLLTLLPPSVSFFRLMPEDAAVAQLQDEEQSDLEAALAKIETSVNKEIEKRSLRAPTNEGLKHLIVAGNVLMYLPPKKQKKRKPFRVFPLQQYVVERDAEGEVLQIIVKECVSPLALPVEIREEVLAMVKKEKPGPDTKPRSVDLYTHVHRNPEGSGWKVYQETKGIRIPGTEGSYTEDQCPWMALRWNHISGEDYGRGLCEEVLGDLISLDGLEQAVLEGSAASARLLVLVKPNGTTKIKDVANAPNGAVKHGNAEDVTFLSTDKHGDFGVAAAEAGKIEQRLKASFLDNTSIQRDAERVTAEEIQVMAKELEDSLGGVYTILSQEFQLPLVNMLLKQMIDSKEIPALPKDTVTPTIVTGLDALGRSHELTRLDAFIAGTEQLFGQDVVAANTNVSEYMKRRATALGVNPKGLVKPAEQVAQEQQARNMQAMAERAAPNVVKGISDHMMASQPQQQPQQ
jgi:hypothetical protein